MIFEILLICKSWGCDSRHVLSLLLNRLGLIASRCTFLNKLPLCRICLHQLKFLDHLLELSCVLYLALRLIKVVLFALSSLANRLSLHVSSVAVIRKLYQAFQSCYLGITFFVICLEHQNLAWIWCHWVQVLGIFWCYATWYQLIIRFTSLLFDGYAYLLIDVITYS